MRERTWRRESERGREEVGGGNSERKRDVPLISSDGHKVQTVKYEEGKTVLLLLHLLESGGAEGVRHPELAISPLIQKGTSRRCGRQ